MHGFYRNKYTTPNGKEVRYGACTQFEVKRFLFGKKDLLYVGFLAS